jgi:uncharacterized protein (DUF885 family)
MTRREWLALAAAAPFAAADSPSIDRFFDDFLRKWVVADPELASQVRIFSGDEQERLDAQLNEISDEAAQARIARAKEGLAGLRQFGRAKLTPEQRLSAEMFEYQLTDIVDEEPYLIYNFPLNQMNGVQARLPTLLTDIHPMRTRRDAENYLARLEAAASKIDQALALTRERARQGVRLPGFIAVETIGQMKRFTGSDPGENILVSSFARRVRLIESIDPKRQADMIARAQEIVRTSLYPAYHRAVDGLASENAKGTEDAGLWRFPKGAEAYAFFLRRYTTTNMTADEIHQKGLDEVARIGAQMEKLFQKLGYNEGSEMQKWQKLQDDHVYPDGPDVRKQVLADYQKFLDQNYEESLAVFDRRPKTKCIVQRIPEFQEANAAANYQAPAQDGSRPGIVRVPLRGPTFSKPAMRNLMTHEGIPGHHFQIALQVEMTSLPAFRRLRALGGLSAYSEGWGLYAERLGGEMGWYKDDPVSDLGHLNGEYFRAKRLVADTGIHAKHWTRQQTIAYGISQSEADRYVVMPGQACSYKIGQLKILELRERAKAALGAKFSIKEYHDVVLGSGSIPLALLERVVGDWAKKTA